MSEAKAHILGHHQLANDMLQQRLEQQEQELVRVHSRHATAVGSHGQQLQDQHNAALQRLRDAHEDALASQTAATHALVEELNAEFDDELRPAGGK